VKAIGKFKYMSNIQTKGSLGGAEREIQGLGSEMAKMSSDKSSTRAARLFYHFRFDRRYPWQN